LQHAASGLLASTDTVIAYRSYRSAFTHETDLSWNRWNTMLLSRCSIDLFSHSLAKPEMQEMA